MHTWMVGLSDFRCIPSHRALFCYCGVGVKDEKGICVNDAVE